MPLIKGSVRFDAKKMNQAAYRQRKIDSILFERITRNFESIKESAINQFENHVVTRELQKGATSSNDSNTLQGYGNLFSFIGFNFGYDPTEVIFQELSNMSIRQDKRLIAGKLIFTFTVTYPSLARLYSLTPMPWQSGLSWAEGIETGISNFGFYMFRLDRELKNSRSTTGLQIKNIIRRTKANKPRVFRTRKYLSEIVENIQGRIKRLGSRSRIKSSSLIISIDSEALWKKRLIII